MAAKSKIVERPPGGQIEIPEEFWRELGVEPGNPLRMTVADGTLTIASLDAPEQPKGSPWLLELYEAFAPVREHILAMGYTEEEVNADIDAAIAASRAERD